MENNPNKGLETSSSIKEISTALSKFQGSVGAVKKTSENPFFKSKYAALDSIVEEIKKPLSENGLSYSQFPIGENLLVTLLMHSSGEWFKSTVEMHPKDLSPQSHGGAVTYYRRYCLSSILGIATEDDDDGNSASSPTPVTKKGTDDYAVAVLAIEKYKTIAQLEVAIDRVEESTKFTDKQKDQLQQLISRRIDELTVNQGK